VDPAVEGLIWKIWQSVEAELHLREPYDPAKAERSRLWAASQEQEKKRKKDADLVPDPEASWPYTGNGYRRPQRVTTALLESCQRQSRFVIDTVITGKLDRSKDGWLGVDAADIGQRWEQRVVRPGPG